MCVSFQILTSGKSQSVWNILAIFRLSFLQKQTSIKLAGPQHRRTPVLPLWLPALPNVLHQCLIVSPSSEYIVSQFPSSWPQCSNVFGPCLSFSRIPLLVWLTMCVLNPAVIKDCVFGTDTLHFESKPCLVLDSYNNIQQNMMHHHKFNCQLLQWYPPWKVNLYTFFW